MFYLVFGSIKRPTGFMGGTKLDWGQPPIGVYNAYDAEEACIAAAKDHGQMATYCAVQCVPWGIDMVEAPAKQLGQSDGPLDRLARVVERIEENDRKLTRLQQLEERSRQMEQEAGIGDEDASDD